MPDPALPSSIINSLGCNVTSSGVDSSICVISTDIDWYTDVIVSASTVAGITNGIRSCGTAFNWREFSDAFSLINGS